MDFRAAWFAAALIAGCAGSAAPLAPSDASHVPCAVQLSGPAARASSEAPAASPDAPISRLVVHGEAPLATLGDGLERRIQRRLAEGSVRIGPAGSINYSAERGAISLAVVHDTLLVDMPVQARGQACRGSNCYASCEPEATVRARVSLLLRPDYGFEPARVSLEFTRGCKVKALGGLLTIDVTPTLEGALEPELAKVAAKIDQQLTNLRADTERLWRELVKVYELPLGGCLVLQPQGIVQGPFEDSKQRLHARFALLARPELRHTCGEQPQAPALPPLGRDLSLRDHGNLLLGMVTPLEGLERSWASASPAPVDGRELRVSQAKLSELGSEVGAELELSGEVCGSVSLRAGVDWAAGGATVGLAKPRWLAGEAERLQSRGIAPQPLLRALTALPRVAPLLTPTAVQNAVPELVRTLSTKNIAFSAEIASARGAGARVRGAELVAYLEARGSLRVQAVSAP
jgi:hypothetical protein